MSTLCIAFAVYFRQQRQESDLPLFDPPMHFEIKMKKTGIIALFTLVAWTALAQRISDTTVYELKPIEIGAQRTPSDIQRLDPVRGTFIYSGKKNEVIDLTKKDAAITEKHGRQVFAKVPGLFVYDMDGTGNQVNIAARGLDPHRGWEFNIRKDGVMTNSDIYGYPASHYNIPLEAVERIELIRGTGSLQYGAQFGGMVNYITKAPDSLRNVAFESINTIGSYGLVSAYNALSGKVGKLRYSVWMNKRQQDGYRDNSESQTSTESVTLHYDFHERLSFKLEWTHSNYLTRVPGPLTDSLFKVNPQMATRSRNYYSPDIHIPSFTMKWNIASRTTMLWTTSWLTGERRSVLFDRPANIADSIVTATGDFNHRQVDIDRFNSRTSELRVLHKYRFRNRFNALVIGVQYINNDLNRQQQGRGTTGSDFDLTRVTPGWGRDIHYRSNGLAIFAENRWVLTDRLSVHTGMRMETGKSDFTGSISYYDNETLPNTIEHRFPLFGAGFQYDVKRDVQLYGGWTQAYRPVILKDIIPQSVFEVVDKNLKDAFGYNAELGVRGNWRGLRWDITGFYLQYNNRLGSLAQTDTSGNLVVYRTNIGNSNTAGVECFFQADIKCGTKTTLSLFTSTSWMQARYSDASLRVGNANVDISGNVVESVPAWMSRNGATLKRGRWCLSALYSYTSETYADALNARAPSATGAVGLVPSFSVLDVNVSVRVNNAIKILLNVNNALDAQYFTKRPQLYPGPGVWPSDGRTISATAFIRL